MIEAGSRKVRELLDKGVVIHNPGSVTVGEDVDLMRISGNGVVIHPGCRINGEKTLILDGVELGREAPVTMEDCRLGPGVNLAGGYFNGAVFMDRAKAGLGAHVRSGTILEEAASVAHTVGLKQTILFPHVTLGSLINFCDCLMSGGTGPKDHSEVGSSYIHFNFTPNQDKATPSLIGDVPGGVMLDKRPIFLGGQGGLVGPTRIAFGTVTAAGSITRKDQLTEGRLIVGGAPRGGSIPFEPGTYTNLKRTVKNNLIYISNLIALKNWYVFVRSEFVSDDLTRALHAGLLENLGDALGERIKRLGGLKDKLPLSMERARGDLLMKQHEQVVERWDALEGCIGRLVQYGGDTGMRDGFLESVQNGIKEQGKDYISVVKGLHGDDAAAGTCWLSRIVDDCLQACFEILPAFSDAKQ